MANIQFLLKDCDAVFKIFLLLFLNSKHITWYNNDISSGDNNSNENYNDSDNDLFFRNFKTGGLI
jgi:hypothetical protein